MVKRRYYPRGLVDPPSTEADHRVLEAYAHEQTYIEEQDVDAGVGAGEQDPAEVRRGRSGR